MTSCQSKYKKGDIVKVDDKDIGRIIFCLSGVYAVNFNLHEGDSLHYKASDYIGVYEESRLKLFPPKAYVLK